MRKLILNLIVVSIITMTLTACGVKAPRQNTDKTSVVATIFAPFDFARQVAGSDADVTMLLPPGSESHSYEPTPQDIIKIQNCDVFVYVGGDSDSWVKDVLSSMDTSHMRIVTLMDCVQTVPEETVEGMESDEDAETAAPGQLPDVEYDEHVWTSPKNAELIVQKISDVLGAVDTANSATYQANTDAYLRQLTQLDADFQNVVDHAKRKEIVVGDRFPFRYLCDAYGLTYYAAFPGCSTQTEASAATVSFLIDKVKTDHIPVVFHIELSNEKIADTIAEATGAKVELLNACHNVSKDDFENGATYLSLMTANVAALKEALQ